jgi:hypothetical protein
MLQLYHVVRVILLFFLLYSYSFCHTCDNVLYSYHVLCSDTKLFIFPGGI